MPSAFFHCRAEDKSGLLRVEYDLDFVFETTLAGASNSAKVPFSANLIKLGGIVAALWLVEPVSVVNRGVCHYCGLMKICRWYSKSERPALNDEIDIKAYRGGCD
jgi:hypothetical protein